MRASKKGVSQKTEDQERNVSCAAISTDVHISGAEGIYPKRDILDIVQEYVKRALRHPKGKPDSIVITVEKIRQKPKTINTLPITTVKCRSASQATVVTKKLLTMSGISKKAITAALSVVQSRDTMRGAAIVLSGPGRRIEPDRLRGVRASRLGISKTADMALSSVLQKGAIDTQTVREAIILASKVASCQNVVAELCVSDDPEYTTGYVASKAMGYVRIPHLKKKGDVRGGRVFFLSDEACLSAVVSYLEKTAVIVTGVSEYCGIRSIDEIIDRYNR